MPNNIPSNGPTLLLAWCLVWLVVESAWAKMGGSCTWIGIACMALLGYKEVEKVMERTGCIRWNGLYTFTGGINHETTGLILEFAEYDLLLGRLIYILPYASAYSNNIHYSLLIQKFPHCQSVNNSECWSWNPNPLSSGFQVRGNLSKMITCCLYLRVAAYQASAPARPQTWRY